jgi:RNA polymerase sigma factor FliA
MAAEAKPSELQDIWRRYKSSGGQDLRDRLILTYAPLVKYVAGRLGTGLPAHVEEGDLISYGLLGLIGAIERYELDRDVKFETYAIARIKGSIIDELRSLDWVPRSVRSRAREIERAMVSLEHRLKRVPTDEELASEIGISESDLQDSLTSISRSSIAALDELWTISSTGGDTVSLIDTIEDPNADDPSKALDQMQVKAALAEAIQRLPERERLVVSLYYYEELTLREIGEVLGVTESRVSQLHTKAILRLKVRLQGSLERAALER